MATLVYGKTGSTRKFKVAEMQIRFLEDMENFRNLKWKS